MTMNQKDRYRQTFDLIMTDRQIDLTKKEEFSMNKHLKASAILASAVSVFCAMGISAFAYDVAGIRTTITTWLSGTPQEITYTETEPGSFTYDYEENGQTAHAGGGGVKYENGKEVPITAEEFADSLASGLTWNSDGTITYYDHELAIDLTPLLKDGTARITYTNNLNTVVYYTIEVNDGESYTITANENPADPSSYTRVD